MDVAAKLANEARVRSEGVAGVDLTADCGDPEVDLMQLGEICGCEVEASLRMLRLELP